jgi:hypothetical protein
MDKLEDFIRKNREDLDLYEPSSGTWKRIEKELKDKKTGFKRWMSIAAMLVVILGTAVVMFRLGTMWSDSGNRQSAIEETNQYSPHLKETEIYYTNLVNSLYQEATPLLTGNPEIKKELTNDMSQLDSICTDIKRDLKDNVANQEVVEALIQNYRIKIRLLEDMLIILKEKENDNNPEKTKSHEL